ncbi:hypothetical protein [uncultured Croceitalea sp.]|uniref:hypothetical protein n=1 Tax=uncultured Croceitalea sp. TaxID=1798908 RepID=UPI00330690A8
MELYLKSLREFKSGERGYSTIFIIIQSCLGSIAAMYILINGTSIFQMLQLFMVTIICMIFNASILAQLRSKLVFNLFFISLIVSTLVLVINSI